MFQDVRRECADIKAESEGFAYEHLTIQQVSDILGKDEKTIRRYEKKGLKSYFIGRTRIYFEDDVLAFIESMGRVKNV